MTAYAIRRTIDGLWWGRYGSWVPGMGSARIYTTGAQALAAYKDHYRQLPTRIVSAEVVRLEVYPREIFAMYPHDTVS